MKRMWLIPLFGLFLLCGSIFPAVDVQHYCQDSTRQLQLISQASQAGQWDAVRPLTDRMVRRHSDYQRRAGWYASDNELHAVQDALAALSVSAEAGDALAVSSACAHVRSALDALAQGQAFTWDALL